MAHIKKRTVLIDAHFQNNIALHIKYTEAWKSYLYSPASTSESQDEIFKLSCETLAHLTEKTIKV